jgi:uncharacterized protein (TIGR03435 family)
MRLRCMVGNLGSGRERRLTEVGTAAVAVLIAFGLVSASQVRAQSQPGASAPSPSFEAASIKLDRSGSGRHSINQDLPGGRLRAINVSLAGFMRAAYQVPASRILATPAWFDSEYFDVEAISADDNSGDENRLRLQALLADRFKLVIHHETRQLPVYALVLAKPGRLGPQFHVNDGNCDSAPPATSPGFPAGQPGAHLNCGDTSGDANRSGVHYSGRKISMDKFLIALAGPASDRNLDRPVVDRTGLTGTFDFTLEFSPLSNVAGASSGSLTLPSLFTALEEQLGLKLKTETAPVDVIVIDHVEERSEN